MVRGGPPVGDVPKADTAASGSPWRAHQVTVRGRELIADHFFCRGADIGFPGRSFTTTS